MVSVFTGAELIRNRQVRAPRESKLGKHKNAGAFFDLLSIGGFVFLMSPTDNITNSKKFVKYIQ